MCAIPPMSADRGVSETLGAEVGLGFRHSREPPCPVLGRPSPPYRIAVPVRRLASIRPTGGCWEGEGGRGRAQLRRRLLDWRVRRIPEPPHFR